MGDAAKLADRAIEVLGKMHVEAELYLEESVSSSISVSSGSIASVEMSEEAGAGIRVFDRGRIGFAYTSDLSPAGVRSACEAASMMAGHADADSCNRLPEPDGPGGVEAPEGDLSLARAETYRKTALARAMEEAARGVDPRVRRVPEARYEDLIGRIEIRNTRGFSRGGEYARVYGSIEVVAEEGSGPQSGFAGDFAVKFSSLDPFRIGREAAGRALAKLGAGGAGSCTADVVFEPTAAADLLEAVTPAFSGERVLKGKSFLAGRLGRRVASEAVTLVDDGRLPGSNGAFPFDAEGTSTRRTLLVESGVLKGFLHNAWSAAKMGMRSTGNATRTSYMGLPMVGATTLYLEPSATPADEILAGVEEGIRVSELMGLHTLDPITGEFSLGAAGHRVRKGRLEEPVAGFGLAGTVAGLLEGVEAVGSDLRLLPGDTAGSTTLVRGLSISGA